MNTNEVVSAQPDILPIPADYMPSVTTALPMSLGSLCRVVDEIERIHAQRTRVMVAVTEMEMEMEL